MDKDHSGHNRDVSLTRMRNKEEVLEISSTGYGYESVVKETEENAADIKKHNGNPS